jgi:hypothetical protein
LIICSCKKEDLSSLVFTNNIVSNSSFESGFPGAGRLPANWANCGQNSPPPCDIFRNNSQNNPWGVTKFAFDGEQYVGMVTRSDGSTECIEQEFSNLYASHNYKFGLVISRSESFISGDIISGDMVDSLHQLS